MRNLKEIGNSRKCDCGADKARTAIACGECTWRDGATSRETRIIDALRASGGEPLDVVRVASLSGTTERSVLRSIGPLIDNGRVIRKEGPPTMYTLGEKRRMAKKKQPELEGFERPCIEEIDDAIVELIDAKQQVESWKMRAEEAQAVLDERMLESESELEADAGGNRSYVFVDGEVRHTAELPAPQEKRKTKIRTKRIPRQELEESAA